MNPHAWLRVGDCRNVLPGIPANSIDAVVTDPPYELGFMGRSWDTTGVAYDPETWAAVLRVMKPGAFLLSFGGTRTFHRIGVAIEDAGFELRDTLCWLHGTGYPKSKQHLRPGWEPIIAARKPPVGSIDDNLAAFGIGNLNIDECRTERGGYPPNVILDETAAELLDAQTPHTNSARVTSRRSGKGTGRYGAFSGQDSVTRGYDDAGGASRFFYCPKASAGERNAGLDGDNPHVTVKPIALMRWLVRLITPTGGYVIDPFCGSGTTGIAAFAESCHFGGIDLDPLNIDVSKRRITHWSRIL